MMKTALVICVLFFHLLVSAALPKIPPKFGLLDRYRRQREADKWSKLRRECLHSVRTTVTPKGQVLDWIPIRSQAGGKISHPPPRLERMDDADPMMPEETATFELELENEKVRMGPAGTVPVLRANFSSADFSVYTLDELLRKKIEDDDNFIDKGGRPLLGKEATGPLRQSSAPRKRQVAPAPHWYARAYEYVVNYGAQGQFSVFEPKIEPNDFSLMQMAVVSEGVGAVKQTLEAGTIVQKARYSDLRSHLFTFYTTNGYGGYGDNVQGWNTEYKGWVQVDRGIYPGCILQPAGTIGGTQYKSWIVYRLFEGNWWLWVKDRWIGYYPASLFSKDQPDASKTLADHANKISMYGEVLDKNTEADSSVTTSDMGSGLFADQEFRRAAYIHNILYYATAGSNANTRYGASASTRADDTKRYTIEEHFNNTGSWGPYVWLGGPGLT